MSCRGMVEAFSAIQILTDSASAGSPLQAVVKPAKGRHCETNITCENVSRNIAGHGNGFDEGALGHKGAN